MMLEIFLSLMRTLKCKANPKQVHDPKTTSSVRSNQRAHSSGTLEHSNNIENFIIQDSKRKNLKKSQSFIDILNPKNHEIVLDGSNSDNTCRCCPCPQISNSGSSKDSEGSHRARRTTTITSRMLDQTDSSDGLSMLICQKCGEKLKNLDAVEPHHISNHSVTELQEDSSRQIIETICGTSSANSENILGQIDCILKVQNMPKTLSCFEEYREKVKIKAEILQKKHPRCLVDGNELLRFHGTSISCSLGTNSSYSLCTLDHCGACQILRHGFSTNKEIQGALGVYTTSTSAKAFDSIVLSDERPIERKSVIVCRVIAGIVYSPHEEIQEKVDYSGFDSLAEKISNHSDFEELYVLNPRALLPCFVVIYKQQTMEIKRFNSSLRISSF